MGIIDEIKRRRTFAIISHPDAGKTTLAEGEALHFKGTKELNEFLDRKAEFIAYDKENAPAALSRNSVFHFNSFQSDSFNYIRTLMNRKYINLQNENKNSFIVIFCSAVL